MANTLQFPAEEAARLEPHMPPSSPQALPDSRHPYVTLTFATSLDSALSLGPGIRTALSGPQSKAMTHYLRSRHDAICIGVGTAIADDPGLNCRLNPACSHASSSTSAGHGSGGGAGGGSRPELHPRPIVVDPRLRWEFTRESKILQLVRSGDGLAPFIVTTIESLPEDTRRQILEGHGGKYIVLSDATATSAAGQQGRTLDWRAILAAIRKEGLHSVMIEGGGTIINSLLSQSSSPANSAEQQQLIDSVIITIAPTWLGKGSVVVSPDQGVHPETGARLPGPRLRDVTWIPMGEDVVVCGRVG